MAWQCCACDGFYGKTTCVFWMLFSNTQLIISIAQSDVIPGGCYRVIIMVNVIPPNHVDEVPVVESNQHDNVPEPVLVHEDEDPEEDELEEEEDPQEEEDDMEIDIEEDKNESE
uniref:Uncharacterized protein n=2 Tax=Tanacetum cinerariifolium TaxID=118510 RepID=A0A699JMY0_TANCI|nr:hypothetical protein [Tanacetum cinerariifolium]